MGKMKTAEAKSGSQVYVHLGKSRAIKQPANFRCCPLGLQFYSPDALPLYETLGFKLEAAGKGGLTEPIDCMGVVVHSQFEAEASMHRIWVSFVDLPERVRENLKCLGKCADFLCPHCENY